MKGTIIRRGQKWSVVIDLGTDPISGKRVRKWHSGYETRREAEAARVDILGQIQRGGYVAPQKQTFSAYLVDEWLPGVEAALRPSTFDSYKRNVELHVIPHIGSILLQNIAPGHLNGLYATLLKSGRADGRGGLSPRSVRYIHAIIHRALRDALRWTRIARNPAQAAEPPLVRSSQAGMKVWTAPELRRFLIHVADDRLAAAWLLSATTGMRRGEVLGLRWADVDLDGGRVSITQTLISVGYQLQLSEPTTAKSWRVVALDKTSVRGLRSHRARQMEERLALGDAYENHGLVFARPDGNYVHPDGFSKTFKQLQRKAGLPVIRLHDPRHTHATLALQAGVHPRVVSERLGHSTVAMTLDTYSHVIPALQEDAAERIAELLFAEE